MSSDNGMTKDKESYYVNYEIASIFRDDMLLICVKRQHTCPGSPRKFLTKYSRGEKEAGGRTERSGRKNKKEKKTFAIFTKKGGEKKKLVEELKEAEEKIRKRKRHLQYLLRKENAFLTFQLLLNF